MEPDRGALLGRDYWLVLSTPAAATTAADGVAFLSGPLTSGPGVRPGSGVTVLRADSADGAAAIAATDPFVLAGLRTAEVFGWRVNEGSIHVRVSLGTGTYTWD
jgi:hypothetical protein